MASNRIMRAFGALAAAASALVLALLVGAPLTAALASILGGAVAVAIAWPAGHSHRAAEQPIETTGLPPLPDALELMEAVDDPLLIVRNRRVLYANPAARSVLGEHIEGVDVRLAIRHPAAAERLMGASDGEAGERITRTELVGLGERERRWEMTATLLKDGTRLVRLIDRSQAHASEQMRTDFVANASHELRTPLATLLGFLETLQDDHAAEDKGLRARFLKIMFDEARRMHRRSPAAGRGSALELRPCRRGEREPDRDRSFRGAACGARRSFAAAPASPEPRRQRAEIWPRRYAGHHPL
jgi:two-component system phosphate regulon sensor histidine kinase PhoR